MRSKQSIEFIDKYEPDQDAMVKVLRIVLSASKKHPQDVPQEEKSSDHAA